MKLIKLTLLAFLAQSTISLANTTVTNDCTHRWWLNLGFGAGSTFGSVSEVSGMMGQLSFNGMISDHLFLTFATTHISKHSDSNNEAHEVALLLGYKDKKPHWYWSGAAGLGALEHRYRYTIFNYYSYYTSWYQTTETVTNVSIPVQGQLFWTPFKHFGLGVIGHASIAENPMAGVMLAIQFS